MFVNMTDFKKPICDKCGSDKVIQVEYQFDHSEHYDGISETVCLSCGIRIGRWSGKELGVGEHEKRCGKSQGVSNLE